MRVDHGLTVSQAAQRIGIGTRTAWRLIESGHLRSYRVGKARRIQSSTVDEFLEAAIEADRRERSAKP